VQLHFQDRPWDLYTAIAYSVVTGAITLFVNVGNLLAIILVLLAPGYVLVAALFPKNAEIDWIERIALSFGLSIAVVPLLGLLLNFTPFGVRFAPVVVTLLVFTVGVGLAAYFRRMREPAESRLAGTLNLGLPQWHEYTPLDKGLTLALAASLVAAGGTIAYVILMPRPGETFTEFYILGPGGNASDYPKNLSVNETGGVIIGVVNHEASTVNYTVRVDLVGVRLVDNATSGLDEAVEVNRTIWSRFNVTLADAQNLTLRYTFRINDTGLWKVGFLLFKDENLSSAYRELHLFVRVSP